LILREKLDKVIERITKNQFSDDIYEARKDYQKVAGEIYEDDKSYEARMGLFLEWYIFDRKLPGRELSPLEALIADNGYAESGDEATAIKDFTDNVHSLFLIKKVRDSEVVVLDLFEDKKYTVKENEGKLIFQKNEIFEARIILDNGNYYFTGNFCFHPRDAARYIKEEIKKVVTVREGYLKELKKKNSQLKDYNSGLEKNAREVEKFNSKILDSKSVDKIRVWNEKLEDLKKVRSELMQQVSMVEGEIANLKTQRLKTEIDDLSNLLMQRLGYMNLKWERSRQIDLNDIYRN